MAALGVTLEREPLADLIPRLDGSLWIAPARRRAQDPASGLVAGQATLDLDRDGWLVGVTVLEEPRFWERGSIGWELPGRASPHRLQILGEPVNTGAVLRLDPARKLWALELATAAAPRIVALGPRSFAALDDGRLVALLADLRGFGRI
ncbi:MAG: hypothetical protein M3417_10545 [Actinomycetota bacterium]|nr:hypothetical protein [Actinomycetota bacterium]